MTDAAISLNLAAGPGGNLLTPATRTTRSFDIDVHDFVAVLYML